MTSPVRKNNRRPGSSSSSASSNVMFSPGKIRPHTAPGLNLDESLMFPSPSPTGAFSLTNFEEDENGRQDNDNDGNDDDDSIASDQSEKERLEQERVSKEKLKKKRSKWYRKVDKNINRLG